MGGRGRGAYAVLGVRVLLSIAGALALMVCASASAAVRRSHAASAREVVTVTRDSAGIPHVLARDFRGLGYGDGYAFARDNLCTLADQFVTVEGQRSRYFGPDAMNLNFSAGAADSNLNSDLFWKYIQASHIVDRSVSQGPPVGPFPQVRQMYEGWTAGYNAFLRSGKLHDPRCKGKSWVHPITTMDLYLRGEQIVIEGSAAQFITDLVDAAPPGAASASVASARELNIPALKAQLGDTQDASAGSNGIGLGTQDTRGGDGMLLANPHFPWRGTERFWMAQLTIPGQYNVMGGTLEGFPFIGIGFNQHLAWTHTVSTTRRFTIFQLSLVPGDPTSYYVDGKPEKMGRVTVQVQTGHGTQAHTFFTTRWGPVLTVPAAQYAWTTSNAYALGDSVAGDLARAANQYLRMGQATSVRSLLSVEEHFLAIPTFNTIAADDRGQALYGDVGNTPNVTTSKISACTPAGLPQLVFAQARVITLDGSRSACGWANDPGTPVPGIFNGSHMPHIIRRDYVENSNDSYWLANPSAPLTGFSPIIGLTDTVQGLRTQLGNQMIAERVAGTDGLGGRKFTVSLLQRMWENDRSRLAELVLSSLVSACRADPHEIASNGTAVDLTTACNALAAYNKTGNLDAHGGWLFYVWDRLAPSSGFWADAFDPNHPLSTPSQLNTANPAILRALADAVLNLQSHGVALTASYGQVQHATRNAATIPIHGCNTGCFNAIQSGTATATNPTNDAPYGEVFTGSSLVMTTELTKQGPRAQGILTYSQATDPTSPWFANLTRLYSQKRWVTMRYTPAQLRADRKARTLSLVVP
ncbi:MAG TPA: penicillin acylase family protein [Solirubrobacteraceae bacterium]|nr:penicillin acylase family protein [Solirubrobacteraceae bacterium]